MHSKNKKKTFKRHCAMCVCVCKKEKERAKENI